MKKMRFIFLSLGIATLLSSCAVTVPYTASNAPIGDKRGVSSSTVVFGIQLNNNLSVADAAKNGSIKGGIASVDIKRTFFLSYLIYKQEIIVTGE